MKRIYICTTVYHLLIAIIKQTLYRTEADLIICKENNIEPSTLHRIKTCNIFNNVISYKEIECEGYFLRWKEKIIHGSKKAIAYYEFTSGLSSEYLKNKNIIVNYLCICKKSSTFAPDFRL